MSNTKWNLDPSHSEIQFKVKHMMISTVSGEFTDFSADLETAGDDFSTMQVSFGAGINSIQTKNADRDNHLKSPDFFDAAQYPKMTFKSTEILKKSGTEYEVKGDLTIRDTTQNITLTAENNGVIKDPYGNERTGFEITGKIDRSKFGLTWSALTEAGGMVVSNDVKLIANVEFVKA